MKKLISISVIISILICAIPLTCVSASADTKYIFIDNSEDKSESIVIGTVATDSGTETVYTKRAAVTYSEPRGEEIEAMIAEAMTAAEKYADDNGLVILGDCTVVESVPTTEDGTLWDDRVYSGDDGVIGAGELPPDTMIPITGGGSNIMIVTGDYGRITTYTVTLTASEDTPQYLTVSAGCTPGGTITINGAEVEGGSGMNMMLSYDMPFMMTAEPDEGYVFKGWYEGVIGHSYFVEDHTDKLLCADADFHYRAVAVLKVQAVFAKEGGALTGDVNLDGDINNRDAMILDRYVAEWKGYDKQIKSMDAADMDRGGSVDNRDAMILDRYVAGWKGYERFIVPIDG